MRVGLTLPSVPPGTNSIFAGVTGGWMVERESVTGADAYLRLAVGNVGAALRRGDVTDRNTTRTIAGNVEL